MDEILLLKELPADQHPAAVYLASLSNGSRRTMTDALNTIAQIMGIPKTLNEHGRDATYWLCNWGAIRYQHAQYIRSELSKHYSYTTANKMLAALRRVCKEAWLLGQMPAEDYQRIASVEGIKGETVLSGRHVPEGEILALSRACTDAPDPAGTRDAAIVGVLVCGGLRRAELIALDFENFEINETDGTLLVHGKRNKDRKVPINNGAYDALLAWIAIRGDAPGPLFFPINRWGTMEPDNRLTTQAIYKMLKKRAEQAGIKDLSPHDLRRTFITNLLDAGIDVLIVAKLSGHDDPKTLARYDRRPEETMRKAVGLLHFPFFPKEGAD